MIRSRAVAVGVMAMVAVLPTAGCYQTYENTVSVQGPTGNGVDVSVGSVLVQDLTIIASEDGKRGSVSFSVINDGDEADALTAVTVSGSAATVTAAPVIVAAQSSVMVGGPAPAQVTVSNLTVPTGNYTPVTVTLRNAGTVTANVPVVPSEGYYASFAPKPAGLVPVPAVSGPAASAPAASAPAASESPASEAAASEPAASPAP